MVADIRFNLVNIDDARWNRTQYRYNTNDQIVETQYSNQFERQSEKFQYDSNLNITEHQFIPSDAQGAFLQLAQQQQKAVSLVVSLPKVIKIITTTLMVD